MSDDITWVTVNGVHIPIGAHEDKDEAIKKALAKRKNGDETSRKNKQIEANAKEAKEAEARATDNKSSKLDETKPDKFVSDLDKARSSRPDIDKWRVDNTHTAEDFESRGCRCYVSKGGSTVAVDKNGDIISVCKSAGDTSVRGSDLLREAVRMGGNRLDSFGGNHDFYVRCGFEPVSYTPFNERYAPDGWRESGCGHEPVVFYRYVGVGNVRNTDLNAWINRTPAFTGEDGYEDAMRYRDRHM